MFKKLVANLPFNPSLINQIGFYSERLRQEQAIRRLGVLFMVLAVIVQSFAVIAPPEKSLAADDSHIMNGLRTKSDILSYFDNPNSQVKAIFNHYNLTREDITSLTDTPNANIFTGDGNDWWTVGLYSLEVRSDVKQEYKEAERMVEYTDGRYVYERQWRAFDIINSGGQYRKAWRGVSQATGQTFWIVQSCGNLTWINSWQEPQEEEVQEEENENTVVPDPKLEIVKTTSTTGPVKPGETFSYKIGFRNKVPGSYAAKDIVITDQLDMQRLTYVGPRDITVSATGQVTYRLDYLPYRNHFTYIELTVRVRDPIENGAAICNDRAAISAKYTTKVFADRVCVDIIDPCPFDTTISSAPQCSQPKLSCKLLDATVTFATREVRFRTEVTSSNDEVINITSYSYDYGDGTDGTFTSDAFAHEVTKQYAPGDYTATVVVAYTAPTEDGIIPQTKECSRPISFEDEQVLGQKKFVENITQGLKHDDITDSNKKVRAGDVIEYRLQTVNMNNYERTNVEVVDHIGDLLDYADIDLSALKESGGEFDSSEKKVIWRNLTIPANSTLENVFRITMKDPIPATNRPSDQGSSFDCEITNIYGNKVTMEVACPAVKSIETIPNTGPGTSMLIVLSITAVSGYFFARTRLLRKELQIIRADNATGGFA